MNTLTEKNNKLMKHASRASIVIAITLIVLKAIAFFITGSVAILSGLFDSVQDMMTSTVNLIAIHHATAPADKNHRFGHGKAQAIGGLIQGIIIFLAAIFLLIEAIDRLCHPAPIAKIGLGLIVTVVAIIMTFILVRFQTYVIQKTNSISIKADRAHYTGDIMMNVGIMISMIVSYLIHFNQLDALFGIGVSIYLFIVVYQIIRDSFQMLMDTEMPSAFRNKIKEIACSFEEVSVIHNLKTRQSGNSAFVQFCVHLDDRLTLRAAHDITDRIEDKIKEIFPDTEVIIHAEPERKIP